MNRALIAVVAFTALSGLSGCAFLTGSFGPHGLAGGTVPTGPSMRGPGPCAGCPSRPSHPHAPVALVGGGILTDKANDSYVAYGFYFVSSKESTVEIPVAFSGTLSTLRVSVTTAPGQGARWRLTVDKNGSPTALTCTVAGRATSCSDYSGAAVVAGDTVDLGVTPFGGPKLARINWSAKLTP